MNLRDNIYEGIRALHPWDGVLLEQLARQATGLDALSNAGGAHALSRELEESFQNMVVDYVGKALGELKCSKTLFINERILVNTFGTRDGYLVDVAVVDPGDFSVSQPPTWALLSCGYKAHMVGADKVVLVLLDRNTQNWAFFKVRGDFTAGTQKFRQYVSAYAGSGTCPTSRLSTAPKVLSHPSPLLEGDVSSYLWKLNSKPSNRRTKVIHPSEFSLQKCERSVAYGILGIAERPRIGARLRRIFDAGHICHDILQGALGAAIPGFRAEVPAQHEKLNIFGHCDGVFPEVAEGEDGLEIKSISDGGFAKLTKPKPDHERQAILYGSLIGLKGIHYVYINKRTTELRTFYVEIDRKKWHKEAARAERLNTLVNSGDLPPHISGDGTCRECKFAWTCRPELVGNIRRTLLR